LTAGVASVFFGASTSYWEMNSYQEFLKGRLENLSLSRQGRLTLAPRSETLFTSEQPVIWSVARGQSAVYVATGHQGQIHKVDAAGKNELVWTSPEPEVFAIALDSNGVLYAGTSPDGKIYRIEGGKAVEYFHPKSKYIWSLAFAPDGSLYAGTGDEGKIFRIAGAGRGEVWYETGQTHVTSLALDREQRLLAGTEPNGILYRVTAKDKAFVLYDANLPEIRAIVPAPDGSIYVAALGGSYGKKQAGAAGAVSQIGTGTVVTAPPTTITIEANTQSGIEIKPKPEAPKPQTPATAQASAPAPLLTEVTGVDKATLYRIDMDNLVEPLWTSKEENIYDVALAGSQILFSTDGQGRVYRLESDRRATLLVETREGEATRLITAPDGILAATSHAGKLVRIGSAPAESGSFESPVHDASNTARWGRINWTAEAPAGTGIALRTRSGNSARPDKTWSEWSEPIATSGTQVASPNARYIQWKAELKGTGGRSPELDSVTIAYLGQNTMPVVKSIQVSAQATPASAAKPAAAANTSPNVVYSITVTDGAETQATSAGTPTQTVTRASNGQLVITWQAEDADGDKLSYSIYFRGEEEREWKLLKNHVTDLALTLDGDSFADGKYRFRVTASDALSNAPAALREGELVSAPVLIDNTPPIVKAEARREGGDVVVILEAQDIASAIRRAEVSLNAGPWMPLASLDGVADSPSERFQGRLANVGPGEHLLVVRAIDSAGNAGLTKVVLR
jgi:sugar lactone lactonase YvrE